MVNMVNPGGARGKYRWSVYLHKKRRFVRSRTGRGVPASRETIFVWEQLVRLGRRVARKRGGGINIPRLRIVADVAGKPREESKWKEHEGPGFISRASSVRAALRTSVRPAGRRVVELPREDTGGEFESTTLPSNNPLPTSLSSILFFVSFRAVYSCFVFLPDLLLRGLRQGVKLEKSEGELVLFS